MADGGDVFVFCVFAYLGIVTIGIGVALYKLHNSNTALDTCLTNNQRLENENIEQSHIRSTLEEQLKAKVVELEEVSRARTEEVEGLKEEQRKLREAVEKTENEKKILEGDKKMLEGNIEKLDSEIHVLKEVNQQNTAESNKQTALETEIRLLKRKNLYCGERVKTAEEKGRVLEDKVIDLQAAQTAGESRRRSEERRTFGLEIQEMNLKSSLKMAEEKMASEKKDKEGYKTSLSECLMNASRLAQRIDKVTEDCEVVMKDGFCLTATDPQQVYFMVASVCTVLALSLIVIMILLRRCYIALCDGSGRVLTFIQRIVQHYRRDRRDRGYSASRQNGIGSSYYTNHYYDYREKKTMF